MDDIELSLKPNWPDTPDDYGVFWTSEQFGKWRIGRIRHAEEINGADKWLWVVNLPLAIPPSCQGRAASRVEAQTAFRKAWQNFLPTVTERDLRQAYDNHQATARRVQPRTT